MGKIAVIGLASVAPKAENVQQFWTNIVNKVDGISEVPPSRWDVDSYYDPDPRTPDKTYAKRGGFIPDIAFNPIEFGIPPSIIEVTDVAQLLALITAKRLLEDAGYADMPRHMREQTGVILGVGGGQKLMVPLVSRLQYPLLERVLENSGISTDDRKRIIDAYQKGFIEWEENSFPGLLGNVVAGRVANRLDLGGMNCVVDAACASSLSAVKMAMSDLQEKRADMVITGGIDTDNTIFMFMAFSKTPAFSKRNEIRPFDVNGDGMLIGEAASLMLLKRLEDAERDGDHIYGVITGIGASSDGKSGSIYAPDADGQGLALRRAYEDAGIEPSTVGIIEAHGTGTAAGDLTEFTSLKNFMTAQGAERQTIGLGTVKSQVGHTKAAAGAVSMTKALLALHHKVLPPTINIEKPNPKFDIENTPIYLNSQTRPWMRAAGLPPRRIGVSSFGFGGTNYHVVLEEYDNKSPEKRLNTVPRSIIISAETPQALLQQINRALNDLNEDLEQGFYRLHGLQTPPANEARIGFVAANANEARERLTQAAQMLENRMDAEEWQHPKGIYYRRSALDVAGKIVALFPGQGSQYVEMGREVAINFPPVRTFYERVDEQFVKAGKRQLSHYVYPIPAYDDETRAAQAEALTETQHAQPAIGALSAGMYQLLQNAGFTPDFMAGHSFGELTALYASGVLEESDYVRLMIARGAAMMPQYDGQDMGTMAAVAGDLNKLESALVAHNGVSVANWNSPEQAVIAGPTQAIEHAIQALRQQGYTVTPLSVSAAFHTRLVGHAQQVFAQAIQDAEFHRARVPVYANATGARYPENSTAIRQQLAEHILQPVRFQQQIEQIYAAGGRIFVEIGPRSVLTNLVKATLKGKPHHAIALNASRRKDSDAQLRDAVVQLQVLGIELENFDPYMAEDPAPAKAAPLQFMINGANYVSPKRKDAFETALTALPHVAASVPSVAPPRITQAPPPPPPVQPDPAVQRMLQELVEQQRELLQVQQAFTERQQAFNLIMEQFKQTVFTGTVNGQTEQLLVDTLQELEALTSSQNIVQAPRVPAPVPAPPAPTQRTNRNGNGSNGHVEQVPPPSDVSAAQPAPSVPANSPATDELLNQLLGIVAEKTGYPVEVLEPSMDLEADLGIDSIKRVEIMAHMQDTVEGLPALKADEMAPLRTLQEISDYVAGQVVAAGGGHSNGNSNGHAASASVVQPTASSTPAPTPATSSVDTSGLLNQLLGIVAEKTGYPVEVLEPSMDLEADLGIDSIKRVEIMAHMQDTVEGLPALKADEMAPLRTLQEISDYVAGQVVAAGGGHSNGNSNGHAASTSVAQPAASTPQLSDFSVDYRTVRTRPLPPPDYLDWQPQAGYVCVVVDDGSALTADVVSQLQGWSVVTLGLPSTLLASSNRATVQLADDSETSISNAVQQIESTHGKVGALIHINPTPQSQNSMWSDTERAINKIVFLLAKHLKPSLTIAAEQGRAAFVTVTRLDGAFGTTSINGVVAGGLAGLTKTLNVEWQSVFCRHIDLPASLASSSAAQIIRAELHDPKRDIVEVGYHNGVRVTLTAERQHA